jgi:hypothetical protein
MGHPTGDPIRWAFYGSTGSTSQAISLFYPGTNSTYTLLATDFVYFTSFMECVLGNNVTAANGTGGWALLSLAAGATSTSFAASTLLMTGGSAATSAHLWAAADMSEAISGPQGVLPSILASPTNSTIFYAVVGTGFVVHSPGTARPSFLNSQVPTG